MNKFSLDFHVNDHRLQNKTGHLSLLLNDLKVYNHLIQEAEQYSCLNIATQWTDGELSSNAHFLQQNTTKHVEWAVF